MDHTEVIEDTIQLQYNMIRAFVPYVEKSRKQRNKLESVGETLPSSNGNTKNSDR